MNTLSPSEQAYDFHSEKCAADEAQADEVLQDTLSRVAGLAENAPMEFHQTDKIASLAAGLMG